MPSGTAGAATGGGALYNPVITISPVYNSMTTLDAAYVQAPYSSAASSNPEKWKASAAQPVSVSAAAKPSSPAPPFYNPAIEIAPVSIEMDPQDAEVIFKKEPFDKSSFPVTVVMGGQRFPGRVQVTGSLSRRFPKKSLLIKVDGGPNWQGSKRISLDGMGTDPTSMRDFLAWDLFHSLGMAAPKVRYTKLYSNNAYVGLFLFTEWIDTSVFERHGLGKDGQFFHPDDATYCGDFTVGSISEKCYLKLSPDDKDYTPLKNLAQLIESTPVEKFHEFVFNHFEANSLINWIAGNILTSNSDTFNKNYFLYQAAASKKWTVVPWDYDLTFGRSYDSGLPFPQSIVNDNFQYFSTPALGSPSPLKEKFLQNAVLYDLLRKRLAHIMGVARDEKASVESFGWFSPANFGNRVATLREAIAPELVQDKFNTLTPQQFNEYIEAMQYYGVARYHYIKKLTLDKTVHGTSRWTPAMNKLSEAELQAATPPPGEKKIRPLDMFSTEYVDNSGNVVYFSDENVPFLLGTITPKNIGVGANVTMEVQSEQSPELVPSGYSPAGCIQRSWFVTVKSPAENLTADIRFEYIQEDSLHNEIGERLRDEKALRLFQQSGQNWTPLETSNNTIANTLAATNVPFKAGEMNRFVACEDMTAASAGRTVPATSRDASRNR